MSDDSNTETVSQTLELAYLRDRFWKVEWLDIVKTRNARMQRILESLRSAAPTIATILLLGETGTGKGLLARLIHLHSLRCNGPFIAVHCGAMTETLIESELFGHEKGAFTGAVRQKHGKFEMAQGGTIFLDEIGTVSSSVQIKLLQVLQDGTFNRVGGDLPLECDVRVIAATNADLKTLTAEGTFRKDLFYRINVFPIEIPPLRDRLEDIPQMVNVFLNKLNVRYAKDIQGVHPTVFDAFRTYAWPGNIRELENLVERAYILESTDTLMPSGFPADLFSEGTGAPMSTCRAGTTLAEARSMAVAAFEQAYTRELLVRNRGRINLSAKEAGVTPRQFSRLMARYRISKKDFKGSDS